MTKAQKRLRELRERQSKERQKMAELSLVETLTDEQRSELDGIESGTPDLERQLRASQTALETEEREAKDKGGDAPATGDAEQRERIELRNKASVGRYFAAAMRGRQPDGAEAELQAAAGVDGIPFELWQPPPQEQRDEHRVVTPAPGTVGINLDVLRPFVFAPAVVSRLGIEMPMVPSGSYASGTITTAATAGAVPKGGAGTTGDVPETAAAFTVETTGPHRIGASLMLSIEDIAAVGQANFESLLREHISVVMSDELDDQALNGDGSGDDLTGIFQRLTDPSATTAVVDFDGFAAAHAGGVDGLWANGINEVGIVAGPATYSLSARTFQSAASYKGETSAAAYAKANAGGWWTNKRMPDAATFESVDNVQQAILYRMGRSQMPAPMRTAVCPHWGYFTIDDIYTGARKGQRRFVIATLVGDVILVQPDAYAQLAFQLA